MRIATAPALVAAAMLRLGAAFVLVSTTSVLHRRAHCPLIVVCFRGVWDTSIALALRGPAAARALHPAAEAAAAEQQAGGAAERDGRAADRGRAPRRAQGRGGGAAAVHHGLGHAVRGRRYLLC